MAYTRHSLPVNTVNNETHYISHKDSYCSRNRWAHGVVTLRLPIKKLITYQVNITIYSLLCGGHARYSLVALGIIKKILKVIQIQFDSR